MATVREIKNRIKTSKNISQVTRAMEMVSAVKMRRAQESALSGREYSESLEKMVRILAGQTQGMEKSIFLDQPTSFKKILLIIVAPKKGLCGPLIGNLQKTVSEFVLKNQETYKTEFSFVTLGKKSLDVVKVYGNKVLADFEIFEKGLEIQTIEPITNFAIEQIVNGSIDAVFVAYTQFINTMVQKPVVKQFLPISPEDPNETIEKSNASVLFEPTSEEVLESLMSRYSQAALYQFYLESVASEHSARMVAMKNAHDSAQDIISDLSLYYNKMRQNSITAELTDSVSARLGQE